MNDNTNEAVVASFSDSGKTERTNRSIISTPSDERKQYIQNQPQPILQHVEEGYHSVPESGNALNVGYTTPSKPGKNNNQDIPQNNSEGSGSFLTALEAETANPTIHSPPKQPQQQQQQLEIQAFEDDYSSSGADDFGSKIKQMASDVSSKAWSTIVSGDDPESKRRTFVQACYLGIAAIFGNLLRLILAQLFGQACSNPETVGWIADEAVLCVTRDGQTTQNEGIIFADLPANLLGSFIMGLLQDGASLGLAVNLPIAFLSPSNPFQSFDIWHLALKTGFCGSLTTFSAWNSEMVVLLVGNIEVMPNRRSMIWRALFGYIIGMETAIGSYVFGRTVAWWLHQWINPELAKEQKEMHIRETKHGIAINRELPLVERRYLHGLSETVSSSRTEIAASGESATSTSLSPTSKLTMEELAPLRRWRESTREARRVESGLSKILVDMETALIARKEIVTPEVAETARMHGWDIDGLREWLSKRHCDLGPPSSSQPTHLTAAGVSKKANEEGTVWYTAPAAAMVLSICLLCLVLGILQWDTGTSYAATYRTMAYSMLFAAPGALLRWKLSSWNGKLGDVIPRFHRSSWLPLGTLMANVLGAMISISMISWEFNLEISGATGYWGIATVRAIKVGFSGCLSTVSTFVSEVHKLTQERSDRGYKYILVTLVLSAVSGMILFIIVV